MGLFGTLSRDPIKSTAAWAELALKNATSGDLDLARRDMKSVLNAMVSGRAGTPSFVIRGIADEEICSLSQLCVAILASEATSLNPNDIPDLQRKSQQQLLKYGVPEEFV